jgi:hypothetical protein
MGLKNPECKVKVPGDSVKEPGEIVGSGSNHVMWFRDSYHETHLDFVRYT